LKEDEKMRIAAFLLSTAALGFLVLVAGADEAKQKNSGSPQADLQKATALRGMAVQNTKGEALGSIRDLAINTHGGRVLYAAVGHGGTLLASEKYTAVPLHGGRLQTPPDRPPHEKIFVLDVDKAAFAQDPGFNKDDWPSAVDQKALGRIRIKVGPVDVGVDVKGKNAQPQVRRATVLIGRAFKNTQGESLGTVRDLMIDTRTERVVYAAVGHGGTLGVGEKLVAVPWDVIEVKTATGSPNDEAVVANVEKSAFDNSPPLDKDNWPSEGNRSLFGKGRSKN
jgi:sporulation protein YlmC with PRC-barrel domain